ncbi:MAG TPA: CoA ester lyase [Chloroflexia bacterium]|nr:CoA ester lyase [Chloroflexia bacterium]
MRTWLFVPGHDTHKIEKALASEADVVILDWEDAVPYERKQEARAATRAALADVRASPRCVVRVNNMHDPAFSDDLAALAQLHTSAVILPKVSDPAEVVRFAGHVTQPIIPLIESALGVELCFAIAKAHPQVERLGFGPLDLMADIGSQWTPDNEAYLYARIRVAFAGRAAGLQGAIDGVYPRLDDIDGLRLDAAGARRLGYAGKMLLHPSQIDPVREVFSPTEEELEQARQIIQAFRDAQARGEAVVRLNGRFIDPPVVLWARFMLGMADQQAL